MEDNDNTNSDNSIGDGAQVSAFTDLYCIFSIGADYQQIDDAEVTDNDNDASQQIDTKCVAVSTCLANSGDHRKVVSHIFGRNKACTRELPGNLWIFWCRKHYQRLKYRAEFNENWHTIQLGLVHRQLDTFENWGKVHTWAISLRKTEQYALAKENTNGVGHTNHVSSCWERFLVPYLGANKTFAQVRDVLNVIENKFDEAEYLNRDKKQKTFPGVEFLPSLQQVQEAKKPAPKKETGYKKITLDQPAFNRKTRANNEYIKEMAVKKGSPSKTPKGSRSSSASKNLKTPDTDNNASAPNPTAYPKAFPLKRNHSTPASDSEAPPTKRLRRLTRGYEKHGAEGDSSFPDNGITEEEEEGGAHEMSRASLKSRCLAARMDMK